MAQVTHHRLLICIKMIRVDGSNQKLIKTLQNWPLWAPRTIGGVEGSGDGQFSCPADVRFTPDGQQLVVAAGSSVLHRFVHVQLAARQYRDPPDTPDPPPPEIWIDPIQCTPLYCKVSI
jgi:hypothetical protein